MKSWGWGLFWKGKIYLYQNLFINIAFSTFSLDLDSSVTDTSSQKQSVDDTSKDEVEGEASKDFEDDSDDDELIALRHTPCCIRFQPLP